MRPGQNADLITDLDSWCRRCRAERTRPWRAESPDYLERHNAERRARYRAEHPLQTPTCVICGESFTGRPDALVCSERCRSRRKSKLRR